MLDFVNAQDSAPTLAVAAHRPAVRGLALQGQLDHPVPRGCLALGILMALPMRLLIMVTGKDLQGHPDHQELQELMANGFQQAPQRQRQRRGKVQRHQPQRQEGKVVISSGLQGRLDLLDPQDHLAITGRLVEVTSSTARRGIQAQLGRLVSLARRVDLVFDAR